MAPTAINLEPYREEIQRRLLDEDWDLSRVIAQLATDHQVRVAPATLKRRLKVWGISKLPRRDPDTPELRAAIAELYFSALLTDDVTSAVLCARGWNISATKLARIRRKMGLQKRLKLANQ